jgi:hypothetical protein
MDEWKDEEQEEEVSSLMYINQHSILIIARQPIPTSHRHSSAQSSDPPSRFSRPSQPVCLQHKNFLALSLALDASSQRPLQEMTKHPSRLRMNRGDQKIQNHIRDSQPLKCGEWGIDLPGLVHLGYAKRIICPSTRSCMDNASPYQHSSTW